MPFSSSQRRRRAARDSNLGWVGNGSRTPPRKRFLIAVVLIFVAATVLVRNDTPRPPHSAFAGYLAEGQVHSVGATWRVPRILGGSRNGSASTWIAAQRNNGPFIQVGVTEDRQGAADLQAPATATYQAFWSTSGLGFHPKFLFSVAAGDQIVAMLEHVDGRWLVGIADANSGRQAHFSTPQEGFSQANQASWLQEDPAIGGPHHLLPYPSLSVVRFTAAQLNGMPLASWQPMAQVMSVKGATVQATPVRGSSFSVYGKTN